MSSFSSPCHSCTHPIEWFPLPYPVMLCPQCKAEHTRDDLIQVWRQLCMYHARDIQDTLQVKPGDLYFYRAKVIRIIDGDTIEAVVDLGFNIQITEKFRFLNFDAAESTWRAENSAEKAHGILATRIVSDLLLDKEVILLTRKSGKYGRWIAYIVLGGDLMSPVTLTAFLKEIGMEKLQSYSEHDSSQTE